MHYPQNHNSIINCEIHPFLNFKVYYHALSNEPYRASFQHSQNGKIYGIELSDLTQSAELLKLNDALSFDPYVTFENYMYHRNGNFGNDQSTLYFLSMMLRRKHVKAKRECSSYVLAIGSKHKNV